MSDELYRPANGTEGIGFMARFCDRCKLDAKYRRTDDGADGCQIVARAFIHQVNDPNYPREWTYDAEGHPTCTAFIEDSDDEGEEQPPPDPSQLVLIADPSEDLAQFPKAPTTEPLIEAGVLTARSGAHE